MRSAIENRRESSILLHVLRVATAITLFSNTRVAEAVIPSVELFLQTSNNGDDPSTRLLLSHAFYGPELPKQIDSIQVTREALVSPQINNRFLCQNPSDFEIDPSIQESTKGAWMIVPRGGCTYEYKTWIAQSVYAAKGIIIYNTLSSRYSFNETNGNTLWPQEYYDYDCDKGRADIPSNELHFFSNSDEAKEVGGAGTGPYDSETNDRLLTGDTVDNLCKIHDASDLRNCQSKRCLVAYGDNATSPAKDVTTVCCAWDIHLNPYPDANLDQNVTIEIPTLFATMEQWGVISGVLETFPSVYISAYSRWRPTFNFSAVLIVLLGVMVAAFAAYRTANDYHIGISKLWQSNKKASTRKNENSQSGNQQQDTLVPRNQTSLAEESLELEPMHALVFLVMSSISLFVLFFFRVSRL